jgi:hypothetical protein
MDNDSVIEEIENKYFQCVGKKETWEDLIVNKFKEHEKMIKALETRVNELERR